MADKENLLRFNFRGSYDDLIPVENGELVRAFDYDALVARLAEVEAERDEALNQLDSARYSIEVLEKRAAKLAECEARLEKAVDVAEKSIKWLRVYGAEVHREASIIKELKGQNDDQN